LGNHSRKGLRRFPEEPRPKEFGHQPANLESFPKPETIDKPFGKRQQSEEWVPQERRNHRASPETFRNLLGI
jgi:hypothetical protein